MEKKRSLVVSVVGPSSSGKTKFVKFLQALLRAYAIELPQDPYYWGPEKMPAFLLDPDNYDHPEAVDCALWLEHLLELLAGRSIRRPVYSMALHGRSSETIPLDPTDVILIDSTMGLAYHHELIAPFREVVDLSGFITAPRPMRRDRRVDRDIRERGRTHEGVLKQLAETVWPMEDKWVLPSRDNADFVIDNTGSLEQLRDKAVKFAHTIAAMAGIPVECLAPIESLKL